MSETASPPIEKLRGRKLGKILWRLNKVTESQLKEALVRQQRDPGAGMIGQILVEMGHCTEDDVREALAAQNGVEVVSRAQMSRDQIDKVEPVRASASSAVMDGLGAKSGSGKSPLDKSSDHTDKAENVPLDKLKGRRMGKILWRLGLVTEEQLKQALVSQQRNKASSPLGQILVEMGFCSEDDVQTALAAQAGDPIPPPTMKTKSADKSGSGSGSVQSVAQDSAVIPLDPSTRIPGDSQILLPPEEPVPQTPIPEQPASKSSEGKAAGKSAEGKSSEGKASRAKPAPVAKGPLLPPGSPSAEKLKGRKIGKILWRLKKVTEEQLREALVQQIKSRSSGPLGQVLVEMGFCAADDVRLALACQRGVDLSEIEEDAVDTETAGAGEASAAMPTAKSGGYAPAGGGAAGEDEEGPTSGPIPIEKLKGRRIGKILWRMGKVTLEQVKEALLDQKQHRSGPLGQVLVKLGFCTEPDVEKALAAQMGIESADLSEAEIPADVIGRINAQTANLYRVIPLEYQDEGKILKVALDNPDNFQATDDLRTMFGFNVKPVITDSATMDMLLTKYYNEQANELQGILDEINADQELKQFENRGESIDLADIKELVEMAPVKKLLNLVLLQAIKDKASDIHFEPFENEFKLRYRVDGVLYEMVPPPRHIALAIGSRIKVMANLDIAERRMPQDGRIALTVHGRPVDLRVAVLPTMFGESAVLRVLDRSQVALDLNKVGMREQDLNLFRQLIRRPNGVCVVTGPTGSGKTTTLYSALNELNDISTKIITCEDPVEYDIDGIIQVQINSEVGLTFAKALRAILRQDPDCVLVGECRDLETAQISIQAALTGHLVFTTLHTNDAPSAVARLLDMGLPPYLITAVVEGVLAQRLVRKICLHCKSEFQPTEEQLMEIDLRPEEVQGRTFFTGRGCDYCNNTGYKGRLGIFEIMLLDDELRELIMQRASTNVIRNEARKRGMRNLRESGLLAIYDGHTTIEEVVKETVIDD